MKQRNKRTVISYILCTAFTLTVLYLALFLPEIAGRKWDREYLDRVSALDEEPIRISYEYPTELTDKLEIWSYGDAVCIPARMISSEKEMDAGALNALKEQLDILHSAALIPDVSEGDWMDIFVQGVLYNVYSRDDPQISFQIWQMDFGDTSTERGSFLMDAQTGKVYYGEIFCGNAAEWIGEQEETGDTAQWAEHLCEYYEGDGFQIAYEYIYEDESIAALYLENGGQTLENMVYYKNISNTGNGGDGNGTLSGSLTFGFEDMYYQIQASMGEYYGIDYGW